MMELMLKMTFWLIAAMGLGFMVAWLLFRIMNKEKQSYELDSVSALLLERNNMIEKLEKKFRNEKIMFKKISDNLKKSKKELAEKTSQLTILQNQLENIHSTENDTLALKKKNNLLLLEIKNLKESDKKRVKELKEFEEVLVLSEERVEKNNLNHKEIVKKIEDKLKELSLENEKYRKNILACETKISTLEEALRLYEADSSDSEFIISKDQFLMLEEQLQKYQKEIKLLKSENSHKLEKYEKSLEDKTIDTLQKESDESSMVKAFRETYKKITKS